MSNQSNSSRSRVKRFAPAGTLALLVCAGLWSTIEWGYNRIYVPEGKSLLLRYKGFPLFGMTKSPAEPGRFARVDQAGNPLPVNLNGDTRSTFTYSIPAGGTFILSPVDSNGQSPL